MIKVTNNSRHQIKVAVNKWGNNDGTDRYYPINVDDTEKWDRSDKRGFVMVVERNGQRPYFVHYDSRIDVTDNEVKNDGRVLQPIGTI